MLHPDLKTYHEDRRSHRINSRFHASHFLGRSNLDYYLEKREPVANIRRSGPMVALEIALPGFEREELQVTIENDVLIVKAERTREEESRSESDYILREFDQEVQERRFFLEKGISMEDIQAAYRNGILTITVTDVPEEEESLKKVVEVR